LQQSDKDAEIAAAAEKHLRTIMKPFKWPLENSFSRPLELDPTHALLSRFGVYSRLTIALAVIWFVVNRPFWRHFLVTLSALAFWALLLPTEMLFLVRHPILLFAVPFAAGFVAANLGKTAIGTLAAWVVIIVLAVATYRIADVDPVTGPWLRAHVEVSVPTAHRLRDSKANDT
jgi:hypothetical protein